jgi:hypothetical protein
MVPVIAATIFNTPPRLNFTPVFSAEPVQTPPPFSLYSKVAPASICGRPTLMSADNSPTDATAAFTANLGRKKSVASTLALALWSSSIGSALAPSKPVAVLVDRSVRSSESSAESGSDTARPTLKLRSPLKPMVTPASTLAIRPREKICGITMPAPGTGISIRSVVPSRERRSRFFEPLVVVRLLSSSGLNAAERVVWISAVAEKLDGEMERVKSSTWKFETLMEPWSWNLPAIKQLVQSTTRRGGLPQD